MLIGGMVASAAVGVAIGMLFAPKRGVKTRKQLAKSAKKLGSNIVQAAGDSFTSLKNRVTSKTGKQLNKDEVSVLAEHV